MVLPGYHFVTEAGHIPAFYDDLLSIRDFFQSIGPVVVTNSDMYSIPSKLFKIFNLKHRFVMCKGYLYIARVNCLQQQIRAITQSNQYWKTTLPPHKHVPSHKVPAKRHHELHRFHLLYKLNVQNRIFPPAPPNNANPSQRTSKPTWRKSHTVLKPNRTTVLF